MNKETEVEKKGVNKYGLSEEERKVIKDLVNQRFDFINYKHQPQSYWKNLNDPLNEILKNVTGTQRRAMITDYWNAGKLEELDERLLADELDEQQRDSLGAIHPSFMGGEFLPPYLPLETEIARIELKSTTSDVISVRARPIGQDKIAYRIVDEYESDETAIPATSSAPLTLLELIQMIDQDKTGYGGKGIAYNTSQNEFALELDLRNFTTVDSMFYHDLYYHYDAIHERWWEGLQQGS